MKKPKIGVALGSGGAKGFAHIGVLKVFEEEGVPIDMMAGSSMGALACALYGVGHNWESMKKLAIAFNRLHYLDLTVPKTGLINGRKVTGLIKAITHQKRFEDCRLPIGIVATDLKTGERVVFKKGWLYEAVRASISIPGIFTPVKIGGKILVDGGVIDRVPATVVRDMGADIVIAVDVGGFTPKQDIRTIFDVITLSIDIMQEQIVKLQQSSADIVLKPPVAMLSPKALANIDHLVEIGEETARAQLPMIWEMIGAWKERL
ncbi:patatin-like phospholipase family protein [Tuberibacillus calidus]|uniref:patatin-like phospholipase family protein n=1 Tax=Tuberibacillus calidus TaxID=340097 RepID=UPI00040298FB|nr:patatin-like phospholipase family protein [Tuberibacillus calidus]